MRNRTQEIRLAELVRDVNNHPNKEELIKLMDEQLVDDTVICNWRITCIKRITVNMEEELHRKLKIQAATDSNTINEVVNEAIKMYLHSRCKNI